MPLTKQIDPQASVPALSAIWKDPDYDEEMRFHPPKFERDVYRQAGKWLVEEWHGPQPFTAGFGALFDWRGSHAYPLKKFSEILKRKTLAVCPDPILSRRLKRTLSILHKLDRFPRLNLTTIQDIAGLRAVVNTVGQARSLRDAFLSQKPDEFSHERILHRDYIDEPKDSGYRGIHLVYGYRNQKFPGYDGLRLEIQIRTKVQHYWATAVETASSLLKASLKESKGPNSWLVFFSIAADAFARREGCAGHHQYDYMTDRELFGRTVAIAEALRLRQYLEGCNAAARYINESKRDGFALVVLNVDVPKVEITYFSPNQQSAAYEAYSETEQANIQNESVQAVLISHDETLALSLAYPNLFLDTSGFMDQFYDLYQLV
jgi:hypothetical protein